jgi:S-DNA-T family DNA segregation ATPase FtsK/SpoIIIE
MAVLSDIARRGRSLGLHLLVSTQRPQHLPRNIIANCALRLCLGVTDTDEASQYAPDVPKHLLHSLRHSPPGTVLIPSTSGTYTLATVDTSLPDVSWSGHTRRSLWCEDLPEHITADQIAYSAELPRADYLVGLADHPHRQSQEPWLYEPADHGPLVVVGESGSGHTTCLSHLASQAHSHGVKVVWGSQVAATLVWQLMDLRRPSNDTTARLVVIDRLDRTLRGVPPEGQAWIIDAVETLAAQLTERGDGSAAVVTVAPGSSAASALSRWNATTCLLRHRDPTQWAVAGGAPHLHDPAAPSGRAVVAGVAMQWCHAEPATLPISPEVVVDRAPEGVLVISPTPRQTSGGALLSLADADTRWQEVTQAIGRGVGVVCSDVSPQLMRQWCGPGHTTPPVVAAWPHGWHLHPGGVRLVSLEP